MPWPPSLTVITVTGKIVHADVAQTPAVGFVRFTTPNVLRIPADDVILTQQVTQVTLDINGEFTVDLPATNDPDVDPVDWAIKVFVSTDAWREQFFIQLDYLGPNPVDFADLPIASEEGCGDGLTSCVTVAQLNASAAATLAAANAYTDAEIAALPAPPVLSVNGETGVVVLDAADVGADPAGSAAAALVAANAYTDLTAIPKAIVDAKGDLVTATADNTPARVAVGTDGQVLSANPVTATGLEWRPRDPDQINPGVGTISRETFSSNTNVALGAASGNLRLIYFTAPRAEAWNTVGWTGGTVAAGATPTLVRFGVYLVANNGDLSLVASTANNTALFAVASAVGAQALTATYNAVSGQRYAVGVLVVSAAAIPSIQGTSGNQGTAQLTLPPRKTALLAGQVDLPLNIVAGTLAVSNCVAGIYLIP